MTLQAMTCNHPAPLSSQQPGSPCQTLDRLVATVYDELRRIAHRRMQGERQGHSLQTTALVNEAYLRLRELHQIDWRDRQHFFSTAAGIMRRVLVDQARASRANKRGGDALRVTLDDNIASVDDGIDLIMLDAALNHLNQHDKAQAQIIELRYFAGLSIAETAETIALSPATVKRKWTLAQAWLYRELNAVA